MSGAVSAGALKVRCRFFKRPVFFNAGRRLEERAGRAMKVRNSIKSLRKRHRDCRVVRRRGRLYVINKTNPRFKARQG